jgi:hypothetical protein
VSFFSLYLHGGGFVLFTSFLSSPLKYICEFKCITSACNTNISCVVSYSRMIVRTVVEIKFLWDTLRNDIRRGSRHFFKGGWGGPTLSKQIPPQIFVKWNFFKNKNRKGILFPNSQSSM